MWDLFLIKRSNLGGRLYKWVLKNRSQGAYTLLKNTCCRVENGTQLGSVCSPVEFRIMASDIFDELENKNPYVWTLWTQVQNVKLIQEKMQAAIKVVWDWSNWGLKLDGVFSDIIRMSVILLGQMLKKVSMQFPGTWMFFW